MATNTHLCLEVIAYEDGQFEVVSREYGNGGSLQHEKALHSGNLPEDLYNSLVEAMRPVYDGNIYEWEVNFFVDHGEIPDELWEAVWWNLEEVED